MGVLVDGGLGSGDLRVNEDDTVITDDAIGTATVLDELTDTLITGGLGKGEVFVKIDIDTGLLHMVDNGTHHTGLTVFIERHTDLTALIKPLILLDVKTGHSLTVLGLAVTIGHVLQLTGHILGIHSQRVTDHLAVHIPPALGITGLDLTGVVGILLLRGGNMIKALQKLVEGLIAMLMSNGLQLVTIIIRERQTVVGTAGQLPLDILGSGDA